MSVYDASLNIPAVFATCDQLRNAKSWVAQLYDDEPRPTLSGSESLRSALLTKIEEAAKEASSDGWDGPGSIAVRDGSSDRAAVFVSLLPLDMGVKADISVTPSGSLSFEWADGTKNQLAILVSGERSISFAAYRPEGRTHGSFTFSSRQIPQEILFAIQKWKEVASA